MTEQLPKKEPKSQKDSSIIKEVVIALCFFVLGIAATLLWQKYAIKAPTMDETPKATLIHPQDSVTSATTTLADTAWGTPPVPSTVATADTSAFAKTPTPPPPTIDTATSKKSVYYVLVGTFSSPSEANALKRDLAQGGYSPTLLPPDSEGAPYQLTAGRYRSYIKAKQQAQSIGYILDLKTSVLKKEE